MSLDIIKETLDAELYTNITTTAIKNENSETMLLGNGSVSQQQVDFFLEPKIVEVSADRELHSSNAPFKIEALYQVNIYTRKGKGTKTALAMVNTLNGLFREKDFGDVRSEQVNSVSGFQEVDEWVVKSWRIECHRWE